MAALTNLPQAIASGWRRTSLRARLLGLMLVLVALALLVSALVGRRLLENQLVSQVDDSLEQSARSVAGMGGGPPDGPMEGPDPGPRSPSPVRVILLDSSGEVVRSFGGELGQERSAPDVAGITAAEAAARAGEPFTVGSEDGPGEWRILIESEPIAGTTEVLAVGLGDTSDVLARFQQAQVVLGLIVLLVLAGFGAFLVRVSLRPLTDIERTAEAIGAGDLSQRVPDADPRTEVGHLAGSINGMLGQIESSVQAREASEQEARASEQRMRRFLDDASHELRTPLTSIRGFSELHRKQADAPATDRDRLVGRIESEAIRMGGLIEDMLLLARLDQARPVAQEPVDLVPLAADAVYDLHTLEPDRRVELDLPAPGGSDAPSDPVSERDDVTPAVVVLGDEARLRQVVANLVRNARVHTPPGTAVHVRVGIDGTGEWGVLEVADDGPGMTESDAARVFERFYRDDPARARTTGGSGLGLPIVASIAEAHGGHVALDTAPGEGTRVTVYLPLAPT